MELTQYQINKVISSTKSDLFDWEQSLDIENLTDHPDAESNSSVFRVSFTNKRSIAEDSSGEGEMKIECVRFFTFKKSDIFDTFRCIGETEVYLNDELSNIPADLLPASFKALSDEFLKIYFSDRYDLLTSVIYIDEMRVLLKNGDWDTKIIINKVSRVGDDQVFNLDFNFVISLGDVLTLNSKMECEISIDNDDVGSKTLQGLINESNFLKELVAGVRNVRYKFPKNEIKTTIKGLKLVDYEGNELDINSLNNRIVSKVDDCKQFTNFARALR